MMNHQHHGGGSPPHTRTTPAHEGGSYHEMLPDMRGVAVDHRHGDAAGRLAGELPPATFGYRSVTMTWSDIASGLAMIALAAAALAPRFDSSADGVCTRRGLAATCAAGVLGPGCHRLRQRHAGRGAGNHALYSRADDAGHGPPQGGGEARS